MWAREDRNEKDDTTTTKVEVNVQTKAEESVKAKPKYA